LSERPLYEQYRARLEALRELPLNFDLERRDQFTAANGWHVDDMQTELPPEPPGPPLPDGSWEAARKVLREYRFADPAIITGIFVPDSPLEERVMLLRGRAFGLTFWFGTRVGAVIDERRQGDGGEQQVWGFNYRTLKGHLERGQMEFTVVKLLESGQVAFRINAFSQVGEIANPIVRLGFRLFGRRVQLRFINRSLERMRRLVAEELGAARPARAAEPHPEGPPVRPVSADTKAAAKAEELHEESAEQQAQGSTRGVKRSIRKPETLPPAMLRPNKEPKMQMPDTLKDAPIKGEDVTRWLTFTSFWGAISYLLACTSLILGSKRQPVKLNAPTTGIGMLLHVLSFMVGGSLSVAVGSILRGKRSTEVSQEEISSGKLERSVLQQALGGAVGSVVPFGMAVGSMMLAERITGSPSLADAENIRWPVAGGAMVASSGAVALAVSQITAWVAKDAKS
jgi:uncharacterized protein (UPF0548 family)